MRELFNTDGKQRLGLGALFLAVIVAACSLMQTRAEPLDEGIFIPPVIPAHAVKASVYNDEGNVPVTIRVTDEANGKDLVPEQALAPGGIIPFTLPAGRCNASLLVWVNGEVRHLHNFCPENYPDEQKTLYLPGVVIVGEDRE